MGTARSCSGACVTLIHQANLRLLPHTSLLPVAPPSPSCNATTSTMSSFSSTGFAEAESYIYQQNELFYHYQPSLAFAIVACVVFGLLTLVLTVQTLQYRQWFAAILAIGALLEFIGYLLRAVIHQTWSKNLFIVSYVFILVCPNFFALVNYTVVGRLLPSLPTTPRSPTCLRIPIITDSTGIFIPSRIAKFFFLSDLIAFFIQGGAAGFLTSSNPDTVKTGQSIVEGGLGWALAFIALFFFVTLYVYLSPTYLTRTHPDVYYIRRMYISLTVTITLLLIRSIYRMVEYVTGSTGYVSEHEWMFGVFDTLLMALTCVMYCVWPYGKYLPQIHYPGQGEAKVGKEGQQDTAVEMEGVQKPPQQPAGDNAVVTVHGADDD